MKIITMYTGPMCNFCDAAKRLFSRNNLKFNEIDISSKEGLRDEMIKKSNGKRTIPQIFFDDLQKIRKKYPFKMRKTIENHGNTSDRY